jgi:2-polyprenyl-3-methyl-5-hydroxy-6-metoxy-1,4-benzoquinol methylase
MKEITMNAADELVSNKETDQYVHGMDWLSGELEEFELSNYRKYQYDLIAKHLGKNILEVGSGDRSFTNQILKHAKQFDRIVSIEPSATLFEIHENKYKFPDNVSFCMMDLFDTTKDTFGLFDTALFVHVLEHVEKDQEALDKVHELLLPDGKVLIEVPALPFLFSVHDDMLGHYRRYTKETIKNIVDTDKYVIVDIWYQDIIGVLGSLYFFKIKKTKLASDVGVQLVKNQGDVYDRYVIPFEGFVEKFIRFPLGLSVTAVLQKKNKYD